MKWLKYSSLKAHYCGIIKYKSFLGNIIIIKIIHLHCVILYS